MKLRTLSIIAGAALVLSSCLKSRDSLGLLNDDGTIITEIADASIEGAIKVLSIDAVPATETIPLITLKYHAGKSKQPSGNIKVKLELDPAAVTAAGLTAMPANAYSLPSMEFEIPKGGTQTVAVPITINKTNMDLTKSYGIGFKITQVSEGVISELAKSIVVNILVKNTYDGNYRIKGFVSHPTPAFTGNFSDAGYPCGTFALITSGATSVDLDPAQPFSNAGALSIFGVYPRFTVNPTTNKITITDAAGTLSSVQSFTDYDSRYDPATKTFYIKWGWNGSRIAIDTLTYCGPR